MIFNFIQGHYFYDLRFMPIKLISMFVLGLTKFKPTAKNRVY